ncbi:phage scaffolding protein [Caloranaerobacter azorensis]|uniref:phage scaffolding protein n=1 Tax=Caloranaerobacter azorensis TaxID=116090 RepID=UPI000691DB97|nr:phage scaffolding protein [Caloranaerobacter azorensis]
MDLKELLGEDLYNQVLEKAGDKKIAIVSDGNWIPKEKFDSVNDEKKQYKQQVNDLNKELGKLKEQLKDNENEKVQETIKKLQEQIAEKEKTMSEVRKNAAIEMAITKAKAKNTKAVKALLEFEKLEVNEDGTIKGLEEQLTKLKETDPYLFEEGDSISGTGGTGNFGRRSNNEHVGDVNEFIKVIHENQAKRN